MRDLVLLPGLNNTAAVWDDVAPRIARDARIHTPTLPAIDSLDALADHLLAQAPARFHLCGFSFGGYVALAMLERAPERVSGLAMVCTGTAADSPQQIAAREKSIAIAAAGGYAAMIAKQAPIAFHPDSLRDPAMMARREQMLAEYGVERFMAHVRAAIGRADRTAVFGRFGGPVAIVAGAEDKAFPPDSMQPMRAANPRATFHMIDRAAHLVPMERPAALADVLHHWLAAD